MSRVIKFRIMDKRTGFYIKGVDEKCFNVPYLDVSALREYLIWEQFTGLLDSTGREIYEGDIVRHITKVEHGDACTCTDEIKWSENGLWSLGESWIVDCDIHVATFEVIGNIHENPTLLAAPALSL